MKMNTGLEVKLQMSKLGYDTQFIQEVSVKRALTVNLAPLEIGSPVELEQTSHPIIYLSEGDIIIGKKVEDLAKELAKDLSDCEALQIEVTNIICEYWGENVWSHILSERKKSYFYNNKGYWVTWNHTNDTNELQVKQMLK